MEKILLEEELQRLERIMKNDPVKVIRDSAAKKHRWIKEFINTELTERNNIAEHSKASQRKPNLTLVEAR